MTCLPNDTWVNLTLTLKPKCTDAKSQKSSWKSHGTLPMPASITYDKITKKRHTIVRGVRCFYNAWLGDSVGWPWSLWWHGNITRGDSPQTLLRDFWGGWWWCDSMRGDGDHYKQLCVKGDQGPQLCWSKHCAIQQHTSSWMGIWGATIQSEEKLMVLQFGCSSVGLIDDQIVQQNYRFSQEYEVCPDSPSSLHL